MLQNPFDDLPFVKAGFPSPATDYLDPQLDFNAYLRQKPSSTFVLRVEGESMIDACIPHGSMVVVDRSIRPLNNSIVVAVLDGERVIKHLVRTQDGIFLLAANSKYRSLKIEEGMDFSVWGTVTHAVIDIFKPRL